MLKFYTWLGEGIGKKLISITFPFSTNSPATCDDVCIFIYVFYLFYFLKIIDLVWEQLFVTSCYQFFVDLFFIFIKNENFHYGMCYSLPYWTKKMSDYEFSSDWIICRKHFCHPYVRQIFFPKHKIFLLLFLSFFISFF